MINKPVNAYPYNVCVNANESFNIGYELPNNTSIDGAYVSIKTLDGIERWSSYVKLDGENVVDVNVMSDLNTGGNSELCWNSYYWNNLTSENYSALISRLEKENENDESPIQIKLIPKISNVKAFKSEYVKSDGFGSTAQYGDLLGYKDATNVLLSSSVKVHIEWDETTDKYSSINSDEAQTLYNSNLYSIYYLRDPSQDLLDCLGEHKDTLGDVPISITARNENDDLVFYANIDNFFYVNGYEKIIGKYDSYNRRTTYVLIFVQQGTTWNHIERGVLDGGTWASSSSGYEHYENPLGIFPLTKTIEVCSGFSAPCNTDDFLLVNMIPKLIKSTEIKGAECCITTEPALTEQEISSLYPYQSLGFFETTSDNWNTSQNFYFRHKSPPNLSVINYAELNTLLEPQNEDSIVVEPIKHLTDVKCEFGINYKSQYKLNCFYLYLMGYDSTTNQWNLLSASEMLSKPTDTHIFDGLIDGNEYAVYCVCYDIDGDEWQSDEYHFVVSNPGETSDKIETSFNQESMTIEISFQRLLSTYKNLHIDLYKKEVNAAITPQLLKYAGGGYCKTGGENDITNGATIFDTIRDYNVRNNTEYQYYAKFSYVGRNYDDDGNELVEDSTSGTLWVEIPKTVSTDFVGTSIIGLSEKYDNVYEIVNEFKILYQRESHEDVINYALSREYGDTIGKYSYEIRGKQNYKTGECTGLLGQCLSGDYIEPALLCDKWQRFVDSDEIKLYRGMNGETLIISIDSTRIAKPIYTNAKQISDITFSFREMADVNDYIVYETELVEG